MADNIAQGIVCQCFSIQQVALKIPEIATPILHHSILLPSA